jgi:hypothetical protein
MKRWASAMLCLPEEKETHMPFPFAVGNPTMQDLLDWVAQPPPAQARDAHALHFFLRKNRSGVGMVARYSGLMFFRPQGAGEGGGVASLPGLNGTGALVANSFVCQDLSAAAPGPASNAKVNIMFRPRASAPPLVFATINFFDRLLPDHPDTGTEAVEAANVRIDESLGLIGLITIDAQWQLHLQKTTVLLRSP